MNWRRYIILLVGALVVVMSSSGNGFFDFNIIELITIILVGIGGLLTLWSWLSGIFGRFRIRFLSPSDDVKAEVKGKATTLALPTGESHVYFVVTPRMGISLESINISFFNDRAWPLRLIAFIKPNIRCRLTSIKATALGVMGIKRDWHDYPGEARNEEAMDFTLSPPLEFYSGKRKVFRVSFCAAECMHNWNGTLGIQLNYKHSGNGESRDGVTKVFVREKRVKRPITFALRHLLWAYSGGIKPSASER